MNKKFLIAGGVIVVAAALCAVPFMVKNDSSQEVNETKINNEKTQKVSKPIKPSADKTKISNESKNLSTEKEEVVITNLYSDTNMIPLSAITQIAEISPEAKAAVKKVTDTQNNVFLAKRKGDKLILVVENQENIRHGIDFIEISLSNGHQTRSTLGYSDKMQDSDNDIWEYDKHSETPLPTKHTKFNKDGDVEFVEIWNYSSEDPIKYEMKNHEGKVISVKKETLSGDTDLRVENILYDENGNTKISVSTTYEGADVKRFTYYNADKPNDGASVFAEFKDGNKVKETVYSSDLKLQNTYNSEYKNGARTEITVLDADNTEVGKYTQQ